MGVLEDGFESNFERPDPGDLSETPPEFFECLGCGLASRKDTPDRVEKLLLGLVAERGLGIQPSSRE